MINGQNAVRDKGQAQTQTQAKSQEQETRQMQACGQMQRQKREQAQRQTEKGKKKMRKKTSFRAFLLPFDRLFNGALSEKSTFHYWGKYSFPNERK